MPGYATGIDFGMALEAIVMKHIFSESAALDNWTRPPLTPSLDLYLEGVLPLHASLSEGEIRALSEALDHADDESWEGRFDAGDLSSDWMTSEGEEPSMIELCIRFACMMSGGTLLAAGVVSGLSLGIFASPLFGFAGFGAAAFGAALCAGGFVIGGDGSLSSHARH